jgi:hypothetical protein
MFSLGLLAQVGRPAGSPFERPEIIWGTAGLAGALLAGAIVIYFVDRWRKQAALKDRESASELSDFRGMYERGEITEAEYVKLRDKVASRVKPTPPAPAGAPPSVSSPTPNPAAGPAITGPLPPDYFDDPDPPPAGGSPPPA